MNNPFAAPRRNWVRYVINVLVALAVAAVAAAAFIFSYPGVHSIALLGGVSAQLAKYYPALFDAVLVIACVTVVVQRAGRWYARWWAWLVAVIVLAAIGYADVVDAIGGTLNHQVIVAAVAAAPAAAVLLAFSLLVALLQKAKVQRGVGLAELGLAPQPATTEPATTEPASTEPASTELVGAELPTVELPAVAAVPATEDVVTGVAPPEETVRGPEPVLDPELEPVPAPRSLSIRYAGGE